MRPLGRAGVRLLASGLLVAFAGFAVAFLLPVAERAQGPFLAFSDFFAQWSFGLFARLRGDASIYDPDALHRFQQALEPGLRQFFPFPYPPSYLFAVWPLATLPFGPAFLAWNLVTLALFLWAVFGGRPWRRELLFVALAPVTVICLGYGQNGLLISALIVAGLRVMGTRPVLGGILLGLATIKPQLGILIPIALLAAGKWRVMAAAAASAVALAGLSAWAFGAAAWPAWAEFVAGHAAWVSASVNDYHKPTVLATLTLLGAAPPVAQAVQALVSIVVIVLIWLCFRRGASALAVAALESGTFLAMPFVFHYDMPMLANAILLFVRERGRSGRGLGVAEAGVIALGLLFPAVTTLTTRFFYVNSVALVLLFSLMVWRQLCGETARPGWPARPCR